MYIDKIKIETCNIIFILYSSDIGLVWVGLV